MLEQAKNITKGWYNLVRKELGVLPPSLQQQADKRLKICSECEFRKDNQCQKCGCFLKAKVLSNSNCPTSKW